MTCKHNNLEATMYCPQCMAERPGGPCGRCGGPTLDCGVDDMCPKCDPLKTPEQIRTDSIAAYEQWRQKDSPSALRAEIERLRARLESAERVVEASRRFGETHTALGGLFDAMLTALAAHDAAYPKQPGLSKEPT